MLLTIAAGPDDHQTAPPCHGNNQNDCRDDPNPDRGKDCLHSEDHVCVPTVNPSPNPSPTTVVSTPTPTTVIPTSTVGINPTPTSTVPSRGIVPSPTNTPVGKPPVAAPPIQLPRSGDAGLAIQ